MCVFWYTKPVRYKLRQYLKVKVLKKIYYKKVLALLLTVVMVSVHFMSITVVAVSDTYVKYETEKNGIITDVEGDVNVRTTPTTSTTGNIIGVKLDYRDTVTVLGEDTEAETGKLWYHVAFTKDGTYYEGYVRSDLMEVIETGVDEESIRTELQGLGFPESYIEPLVQLKLMYPNWKFVPYFTNYDWNKMVEVQMANRRSLVQSSYPSSWKSLRYGDFDWVNNCWIIMEGNDRVNASQEIIEYYLDPRNFFDASQIFQFELLSFDASLHSITGVESILKNTFMDNVVLPDDEQGRTYSQVFMSIGSELKMSPYYLASKVVLEQGRNGNSPLISGTYPGYEGYYNFFNVGATGMGSAVITNGLQYAKTNGWDTRYKSLYGGASGTISSYIDRGQNTLYLQKFDVVDLAAGSWPRQYAQYIWAASTEASNTSSAYDEIGIKNSSIVFRIPIYENMPENACPKPVKDGNPNYKLGDITVSGYQLSPSFDTDTLEYSLIVENDIESVDISATPYASTTNVTGVGKTTLEQGENVINVVATAENGDVCTYTLRITRKEGSPDKLQALAVEGYNITPAFNSDIFEYTLTVPYTTSVVNIGAKAYTSSSVVEGTGDFGLNVGENTAQIKVTGANGTSNTYTISITRADEVVFEAPKYFFDDTKGTVNGFKVGSDVSEILTDFTVSNGSVKILDCYGIEKSGIIATGDIVAVYDVSGNIKYKYSVVVYGDLNGDGNITLIDYTIAKKYLWGTYPLDATKTEALDVNHDGKTSLIDRTYIKKYLWKTIEISQSKNVEER